MFVWQFNTLSIWLTFAIFREHQDILVFNNFSTLRWGRYLKSNLFEDDGPFILNCSYHGSWCISSHDNDLVFNQKYFSFSILTGIHIAQLLAFCREIHRHLYKALNVSLCCGFFILIICFIITTASCIIIHKSFRTGTDRFPDVDISYD